MSEPQDIVAETQLQLGLPAARARQPALLPPEPEHAPAAASPHPARPAAIPAPPLPPVPQSAEAIRAVAQGHRGRVVVQDAFALLAQLPDESVDLVVTDPPYQSLELHRSRGTTTRLTTDWFSTIPDEKLPELLAQVARVLRPDRHFYLFCDEVTADVIKRQQNIGGERMSNGGRRCASGLIYWKELIWAKTTLDGAKIRGGTGYHFRASCERILFFEKGKRALSDLGIPDVLLAPRPQVAGPAVKPSAIVRTLISQSTREGELVVDPFCGSGVVGVEARGLNRRFLLGDIDLAYLDPALADAAPPGLPRSPALLPGKDTVPLAPPVLEELAAEAAADPALHAVAEAIGWLDGDAATPELLRLSAIRAHEREAAIRRALRTLTPAATVQAAMHGGEAALGLLQQWRAWALGKSK
jgi:site-specific DNA-methyltransferase (adenine-specific)